MKICLIAVENSADHLGAELAKELRHNTPSVDVFGIGGAAMAQVGIQSRMDIEGLAILGFVEGVKALPLVNKKVVEAANVVTRSEADAVVLIDSWGFMIRLAQKLRDIGFKGQIIKYVAPQVWAMRAGRAKILARHVDHLLSLHSFDAPYFERHGLAVTHVGNPVFDTDYSSGDATNLTDIEPGKPVLSLWFGSRRSEIETLKSDFVQAAQRIQMALPDIHFAAVVSDSIRDQLDITDAPFIQIYDEARKLDVMAASTAALACSGTVTTQLASAGVPSVVAYRLNALTYFVAKRLYGPDYISIVNIAAEQPLMPEFVQADVTPAHLAEAVLPYLEHEKTREMASRALLDQTRKMGAGQGQASQRAARALLALLS